MGKIKGKAFQCKPNDRVYVWDNKEADTASSDHRYKLIRSLLPQDEIFAAVNIVVGGLIIAVAEKCTMFDVVLHEDFDFFDVFEFFKAVDDDSTLKPDYVLTWVGRRRTVCIPNQLWDIFSKESLLYLRSSWTIPNKRTLYWYSADRYLSFFDAELKKRGFTT